MKKLLKFMGIFIVIVIVAFGVAMFLTSDLKQTADNFFKSIKSGNYEQASKYLSTNFKQSTTMEQLKRAFPLSRFKNYKSCSFSTREVNADGTGKLKGKVEFTDGSSIIVEISLIKENDSWKIDNIQLPKSGIIHSQNSPTKSVQKVNTPDFIVIVQETMQKLGKAISTGYYSDFYSYTAPQFQNSVSLEKLSNAFYPFKSIPIDWERVGTLTPVIEERKTLKNGVLKLVGYFPSEPKKVGFDFEYFKNGEKWQVVGVFLKLRE